MQKLITLAAAAFIALAGCQTAPTPQPAPTAGPALSDEAKAALAKAEADVKAADAKGALWTVAADALKAAQEAAKKGDSAAVIQNAKKASEFASMGIAQKSYPLSVIGK